MFRQKELLDQEGYVVVGSTIKSQHRKKLFNSARATPESLPLASYGLTLSLKKPKLASRLKTLTQEWFTAIPHVSVSTVQRTLQDSS